MPAVNEAVHAYIDDCCRFETPPRVSELAEKLGMSRVTLNFHVKRAFGMTAHRLLKELQVARSQQILDQTELSTTAVGYRAGFGTRRSFYRAFRNVTGVTPARYRRG
jgi:AraC-like DNA-binding protein